MRQIIMVVGMMMIGSLVYGQKRTDIDPSYSVNNYKQSNKAAYAQRHNLDKSVQLQTSLVTDNGHYKHNGNKGVMTNKAAFSTRKEDAVRKSEKHPLGL